jgi:calpain-7
MDARSRKNNVDALKSLFPGIQDDAALRCLAQANGDLNAAAQYYLEMQTAPPVAPIATNNTVSPSFINVPSNEQSIIDQGSIIVPGETASSDCRLFLPFDPADFSTPSARERYFATKWKPQGTLTLNESQQKHVAGWKRLSSVLLWDYLDEGSKPRISPFSVQQAMVGSCSLLSSLIVAALAQSTFSGCREVLVNNILASTQFPGRYTVKFYFNGCWRLVDVDDTFPHSSRGEPLVSAANTRALWVSLLEKAYMHVHCGYERPMGSANAADFRMLTGWIPENVSFVSETFESDFYWLRLLEGQRAGRAVCMLATNESVALDDRPGGNSSWDVVGLHGLVPSHSYAVLDVYSVSGKRLLKIKNPWARYKWTGAFSRNDTASWTAELKAVTGYDPANEYLFDNGVFFMAWDDVTKFFSSMTLCWNPAVFPHKCRLFDTWFAKSAAGSYADLHSFRRNPQFLLTVQARTHTEVLILLGKHVVDWDREHDSSIAVHVFPRAAGQHDAVSLSRNLALRTVYFNGRENLARLDVPAGNHEFVVVPSQYRCATVDMNFALEAVSMHPCQLTRLPLVDPRFRFSGELSGEWSTIEMTCGGPVSSSTFYMNPQIRVEFSPPRSFSPGSDSTYTELRLELETLGPESQNVDTDSSVRIDVLYGGERVDSIDDPNAIASTGAYVTGLAELSLPRVMTNRPLTVVVSQYRARPCPFVVRVWSSRCDILPYYLPREGDGMMRYQISGQWLWPGTAGGCSNHATYYNNPTYSIIVPCHLRLKVRLRVPDPSQTTCSSSADRPCIGLHLFVNPPPGSSSKLGPPLRSSGTYHNRPCGCVVDVDLRPGVYLLIASTFSPAECYPYEMTVFTSVGCQLARVR